MPLVYAFIAMLKIRDGIGLNKDYVNTTMRENIHVPLILLLLSTFLSAGFCASKPKTVNVALRPRWNSTSLLLEAGYTIKKLFFFIKWKFHKLYQWVFSYMF